MKWSRFGSLIGTGVILKSLCGTRGHRCTQRGSPLLILWRLTLCQVKNLCKPHDRRKGRQKQTVIFVSQFWIPDSRQSKIPITNHMLSENWKNRIETNVYIVLQLCIFNSWPARCAIDIPNLYLGIHLFVCLFCTCLNSNGISFWDKVHLACIFRINCADVNYCESGDNRCAKVLRTGPRASSCTEAVAVQSKIILSWNRHSSTISKTQVQTMLARVQNFWSFYI